jgi:hypothetical protein
MQHLSSKQASPSPAVGLWRIISCLTPEQTRRLTREIELLTAATATDRPRGGSRSHAPEGVRPRHSQRCPSRHGGVCGCSPAWEAWVYSRKDKGKVRKTFSECWEAKAWRHEQLELASIGRLRAPSRCTLGEAASLWVEMAREGRIRNRSGRRLSRVRYALSRQTYACTWFLVWVGRSWWASRVGTSSGSWVAGLPRD